MFDWIEQFMEEFGCDWETAAREYHYQKHAETYNPDDYDDPYGYNDYDDYDDYDD